MAPISWVHGPERTQDEWTSDTVLRLLGNKGRKDDRCPKRETSGLLAFNSQTLPGIQLLEERRGHSRKGHKWLEAEVECGHECGLQGSVLLWDWGLG